jgi:hypothetical protein
MIISNEQAVALLQLKKKIILNDEVKDRISIQQTCPMNLRYDLVSDDDDEFSFLWEISQSSKNNLRISLHFQEDDSKIGLLRVDYNSGHHNPEIARDDLPELFRPYIGKWFTNEESHVHYHVDGYKSLAWAVPIEATNVQTKEIKDGEMHTNFVNAIMEFAQMVNIETVIMINRLLI